MLITIFSPILTINKLNLLYFVFVLKLKNPIFNKLF